MTSRSFRVIPPRPATPRRLRVAGYARVSTEHERQLSSIAAQVSYYSHLIQSTPGWDYAGVFGEPINKGDLAGKIDFGIEHGTRHGLPPRVLKRCLI